MKKIVFLIFLIFLCVQTASAQDQTVNGNLTVTGNETVQGDATVVGTATVGKGVVDGDSFVQGNQCVGSNCPSSSPFISNLGNTTLYLDDSAPQIFMRDPDSGAVDFAILVDDDEFGIYNEDTTTRLLTIGETGIMQAAFDDSTSTGDGLTTVFRMSADNQDLAKVSDAGFSIENVKEDFKWVFRTNEPSEGFAATKLNTGGVEFEILNTTTDFRNVSLELGNGASCDSTGQWLNASSRDYKENIQEITSIEAMKTLKGLQPVKYNFKRDVSKDLTVGFIAEDVPDLVATKDRKALSPLEIVAVLTKVVQEQQALVAKLSERITELEKE